jgi:hypothetical protein
MTNGEPISRVSRKSHTGQVCGDRVIKLQPLVIDEAEDDSGGHRFRQGADLKEGLAVDPLR